MRISFTGRQMAVPANLREETQERVQRLSPILHEPWNIHVILTAEKHRSIAEVTLKMRHHILVGIAESADVRNAIKGALEKLKRQILRLVDKRRTGKRRPKPASAVLLNVLGSGNGGHREERSIIETERIPIKPLTIEEARDAMDLKHRGVVVFRNSETQRVNVLYRRDDGNLGLIEPEQ